MKGTGDSISKCFSHSVNLFSLAYILLYCVETSLKLSHHQTVTYLIASSLKVTRSYFQHTIGSRITIPEFSLETQDFSSVRLPLVEPDKELSRPFPLSVYPLPVLPLLYTHSFTGMAGLLVPQQETEELSSNGRAVERGNKSSLPRNSYPHRTWKFFGRLNCSHVTIYSQRYLT
jgi:hypothetical protein